MNILFLSRRFYPDIGGVEKHVMEIGKIMVKNGHRVTVVTQSKGPNGSINGINVQRIGSSTKKLRIWREMFRIRRLIKKSHVVHAHDVYFWYFPFRFLYILKKSYVTFHGFEGYPIKKNSKLIRKISEIMSDGNIAVGEFIKKWYRTNSDMVTYGGVEVRNSNNTEIIENSAVFIGRLDKDTGILEYLMVEKIIKKKIKDFRLKVIGDGKLKNNVLEKNYYPQNKNYLSQLNKSKFVFSSSYLMILEALATKKLVFSVYSNDLKKDYLYMSPFKKYIVIEDNPKDLAGRVIYYLNNTKEKDELVNKGFLWAKNQTWEKLTNKYYNLWQVK